MSDTATPLHDPARTVLLAAWADALIGHNKRAMARAEAILSEAESTVNEVRKHIEMRHAVAGVCADGRR